MIKIIIISIAGLTIFLYIISRFKGVVAFADKVNEILLNKHKELLDKILKKKKR